MYPRVRGDGTGGRRRCWIPGLSMGSYYSPLGLVILTHTITSFLPLLHSYTLNPPWKVDRVLANQSLLLTAGTPSNIPFAWFLVLGCNRQAWVVESQQGN